MNFLLDVTPGGIAAFLFCLLFLRGAYVTIIDVARGLAWFHDRSLERGEIRRHPTYKGMVVGRGPSPMRPPHSQARPIARAS